MTHIAYRPGAFLSADLDKASEDNERNGVVVSTPRGDFGVVQIAENDRPAHCVFHPPRRISRRW